MFLFPFTPTDRNATVGGDRKFLLPRTQSKNGGNECKLSRTAMYEAHSMESCEKAMRMANVSEAHLHLIEGVCL